MIKNNLLGQVLIGILVLFLLISSIQMFGWGQGISKVELDEESEVVIPSIPKSTALSAKDSKIDNNKILESIKQRPVFSVSREPFVEEEVEDNVTDTDKVEIAELKAKVTSIVITPEQSYAMVLDNTTNKRETYTVGMPLDGEQGGWTINSIQPRKVVFVSEDNKTEEIELEVYSGSLKTKKGRNNKGKKGGKNKPLSRKDKKKNADDIRKKIAERRAQMRAEAAKKNK